MPGVTYCPVTGVSINNKPSPLNLPVGALSTQYTATVSPSGAVNKSVSWSSGNPGVAGVSDGMVTAYAVGSAGGETNGEMFNFGASYGVMIRNGRLAELVRDVKLMGNVFTTMENIDMIGNDPTGRNGPGGCGKGPQSPLPCSGECPHIRIQNVIVGGVK